MSLGSILSRVREANVAKVAKEHPTNGPLTTTKGTGPDAKHHLTEEGSKLLAHHKIKLPADAPISDKMANLLDDLAQGKLDKESSRTLGALQLQRFLHH